MADDDDVDMSFLLTVYALSVNWRMIGIVEDGSRA